MSPKTIKTNDTSNLLGLVVLACLALTAAWRLVWLAMSYDVGAWTDPAPVPTSLSVSTIAPKWSVLPQSLRLRGPQLPIIEIERCDGDNKYTLRMRPARDEEQYVLSESRWIGLDRRVQNRIIDEWQAFQHTGAHTNATTATFPSEQWMVAEFYKQFLIPIFANLDHQESLLNNALGNAISIADRGNAYSTCGSAFAVSNPADMQNVDCVCIRDGQIKVHLGAGIFVCAQVTPPQVVVDMDDGFAVAGYRRPLPTLAHYDAPLARVPSTLHYFSAAHQFALVPSLDALVPLPPPPRTGTPTVTPASRP